MAFFIYGNPMAFNGSGTFSRVHNWQEDADNSIDIVPDRHDEEDDGFADGLSNCMTRDGQSPATANIPFGGFRATGLAAGVASTDAPNVGQLQSNSATYAASTGSANAYVFTPSPAISAYAAGQKFTFLANFLSTAAATLNVSGLGAKNIKVEGLYDLPPYAIKNGQMVTVVYDGTSFQPLNLGKVTGDLEDTISSTPKPGWLILNGTTTIGSGSSGATVAASYTEGLYRYIWDRVSDTYAAVSTGRGANAAADFAANKTLTLPNTKDRVAIGINSTVTAAMETVGASTVASSGTIGTSGATTLDTTMIPSHQHTYDSTRSDIAGAGGQVVTSGAGTGQNTGSVGGGGSHTHSGGTFTGSATSVIQPSYGVYHTIKI